MGYSQGTVWTEDKIISEIKKAMTILCIERMPSNSEFVLSLGDHALTNKIAKTGGFRHWAKKLNLNIKDSEYSLAVKYEEKLSNLLISSGLPCEITSTRHPYDVLVDGSVKVDVKVSNLYQDKNNSSFWSFGLHKKHQTCDIFVFYCLNGDDIVKTLVAPSHLMPGNQLSIGHNSRYDIYKDKYETINEYVSFMSQYKL